ncbi:MAG: PAS domain S-box protein, partial [Candidatus Aminicenantes bacterium]|nr:PAS domain S-box protein [Candidatus Aminicenantes bacterium]
VTLQESLDKYETILANIQEGYYEVDLAGNFTFCNDSLCRMLGYPKERVLGMNNREYMDEGSTRKIYAVFNEVFKTGKPVSLVELEVMTGDGLKHHAEFSVSLVRDIQGQPTGFRGIVRDITERKKAEQALLEANSRLTTLVEAIPDIVYFKDNEYRNLIVNSAFEELTGLRREEITGKKDDELLPADLAEHCRRSDEEVMQHGKLVRLEEESTGQDGRKICFETIKAPIFDQNGSVIGLVGVSRDITERKLKEEAIRASEERFRLLAQNAQDLIYRYDFFPEPRFSYVSPSALPITGYTPEEHYADPGLGFKLIHPEDRHLLQSVVEGKVKAEESLALRWRRKDGTIIWTEQRNVPIYDESGNLIAIEGIARDITERKRAEEKIKASLQEKEVLLKEIHHRVKNNLQVISSLLNLQSRSISDPQFLQILRECQNRVRSMALVHEKLYQSRDLSRINFSEYIRNLAIHLFHVYEVDSSRVRLKHEIEDILLDVNTAIPCGLILNELISNSLKHAFPDGWSGEVSVELKRQEDGKLLLAVRDDGVGIPEDTDIRNARTLGMQIVSLLVQQLDGCMELRRSPGTEFRILFQEPTYTQRI